MFDENYQSLEDVSGNFCCGIVFCLVPFVAYDFLDVICGQFFSKFCQHVVQGRLRGYCKGLIKLDCFLSEKSLDVLELRFSSGASSSVTDVQFIK